jgi:hypothetical protein
MGRPDLTPDERRALRAAAKVAQEAKEAAGDPRLARVPLSLCPEPTMAGRRWTPEMDALLSAMWRQGRDVADILERMPRTPAAIFARLEQLGLIAAEANPYPLLRR